MRDPESYYRLQPGVDEAALTAIAAEEPVLLHSLSGFVDAGQAGRLAVDALLADLEHRVLASFDLDDLFDYRARRPRMAFLSDHFASVDMPELVLREVHDAVGTRFLLLHGMEPDHAWRGLTAAVAGLVERLGVRLSVGMHAIPWPAPHTRPIGVTAHATDPDLLRDRVEHHQAWVGSLEVPGHLGGVLELTLGDRGHAAMGFAAHVPHYLVNVEFPRAAAVLLEQVSRATGLALPLESVLAAGDAADADVTAQIASSPENLEAVEQLEAQYDALLASRQETSEAEPLPSAEELGAQVEQFLADMDPGRRDER